MISCAAVQKLERYGYLALKRHNTEDFVATSVKDAKRANVYALTQLDTWREAVQAVRGALSSGDVDAGSAGRRGEEGEKDGARLGWSEGAMTSTPASFTDALMYAVSFAVALINQHVLEVATTSTDADATNRVQPPSALFTDDYAAALALLTVLKDMGLAISSGQALRRSASSDDFTKAAAHLLTNVMDLALVLLATLPGTSAEKGGVRQTSDEALEFHEQMLAQGLVLTACVAQMLRRVQASYPVPDLYTTRPCAALLKQVANKYKQQQQQQQQKKTKLLHSGSAPEAKPDGGNASPLQHRQGQPLLDLLECYIEVCTHAASATAAGLFSSFSLFQRLSVLHGALAAVTTGAGSTGRSFPVPICRASEEVQHWLSHLLSSTACNRATRYVVYFREDELRLMQHNIRQASEYALYTFTTTPPVDPGLVESLLGTDAATSGGATTTTDATTRARAALVLALWCVSVPLFFESFCQDESWASFAQEQRRLVLLQQSRARRGLEKKSQAKKGRRGATADGSDSASVEGNGTPQDADTDTASLLSFRSAANHAGHHSVAGSVTSLASRVSLLSTFSKHSAASYLSFLSVLRPSRTGSVAGDVSGTTARNTKNDNDDDSGGVGERQLHESEDGNTNLPLILLEQLTLGLYRFMETYPAGQLDAYGLRSISWSCIARMFAFVEASLMNTVAKGTRRRPPAALVSTGVSQPLFNLAQDIRYNKGMGYECLGLLFAKAVAPLLDANAEQQQEHQQNDSSNSIASPKKRLVAESSSSSSSADDKEEVNSRDGVAGNNEDDGGRSSEASFFAKAAALASATVGRANLSSDDDPGTRRHVEAALSTCLAAYETVAPQVIDMNLPTILRLAARAAATAAMPTDAQRGAVGMSASTSSASPSSASPSSWAGALLQFLQDITRRLGRSNELPHLVDALLGRGEAATSAVSAVAAHDEPNSHRGVSATDELQNVTALRRVFSLPRVRHALIAAARMSLDPESLLLHLTSVVAELEEGVGDALTSATTKEEEKVVEDSDGYPADVRVQRALLTLEVMEAVLEGVSPTSVSASAVLEQTTQLELLLTSSFVKCVETLPHRNEKDDYDNGHTQQARPEVPQQHLLIQHARTIRQCRAVTALCLQDLGSQQVHEYLVMLDETLWQLSTDIGQLIGTLTLQELRPLLDEGSGTETSLLLLPSLVLQRLSLARAVTAALGTTAGPSEQLQAMVAYIWSCVKGCDTTGSGAGCRSAPSEHDYVSLLLANQMNAEDWISVVALGKEKHARAAMTALLARSVSMSVSTAARPRAASAVSAASVSKAAVLDAAWVGCCLRCIPGTTLRALVDVYMTLSVEDLSNEVLDASATSTPSAQRWSALLTSLVNAYDVVGHNPYWPSVLTHTVRGLLHLVRVWRKAHKSNSNSNSSSTFAVPFNLVAGQLLALLLCVMRSEARAGEVLRKALFSQVRAAAAVATGGVATHAQTPVLSRSGMSVAYVESIKVPVTTLSDLAAPQELAASAVDAAGGVGAVAGSLSAQISTLRELSFEEELDDLCGMLFHSSFVRHLFSLADLAVATGDDPSAAPAMCMNVMAFLYQVSLATAQTAWRTRATDGNLDVLRTSAAVTFLDTVAGTLHTRMRVAATDIDDDASSTATMLLAFLESLRAKEDQYLFAHIAAARTCTTEEGSSSAGGALDALEEQWKSTLCLCASAVMEHCAGWSTARHAGSLRNMCDVFCVLLARFLTSAQHKQQQMSKSGNRHHRNSGYDAGKRTRRGGAASVKSTTSDAASQPAAGAAATGGVPAILHDIVSCSLHSPTEAGENSAAAGHGQCMVPLVEQLTAFFDASSLEAVADALSAEESAVCAWWLLWQLLTVSTTAEASRHVQTRVKTFLEARREATTAAAVDAAMTLRACARVLAMLPAEAAPPLFFDHIHAVLLRVIPAAAPHVSSATDDPRAIAAAAELVLQLCRVRPRLPAWRLLPHGQRLLVWLTRPHPRNSLHEGTDRAAVASAAEEARGPSLSSQGIRLCAAMAAHPLACASSTTTFAASRLPNMVAGELLDNIWLLLLSLLQGSAPAAPSATATATTTSPRKSTAPVGELSESELIQVILLLTNTWLRSRQQQLWSRPAMLPPVMCALFTCVMRGMEAGRLTPRVLNVLAGGLAAIAAHVDAATAAEGDGDCRGGGSSNVDADTDDDHGDDDATRKPKDGAPPSQRHKTESTVQRSTTAAPPARTSVVSARLKRMALTATTAALFEVAQHYVHVFTTFSSDTDFLFNDFLRVLSQHFLPKVKRPPIAYHVGVRIGGSTLSDMTFADLAYMCVGNAESKTLLKQAALRMEEEDGGASGSLGLTDGSRSIFHVA